MPNGICTLCGKSMYCNSRGDFECRNFDCPPGTEALHWKSWKLKDKYRPLLLELPASRFTVLELGNILNAGSGDKIGFYLEELAKREGVG